MTTIGTLTVTTYRAQPDQIDYAFADNSVSVPHLATFRRTLPVSKGVDKGDMRVNFRVSKMVAINAAGDKKEMQFNVTGIIPVGVDPALIDSTYNDELLVAAAAAPVKALMRSGDINLAD